MNFLVLLSEIPIQFCNFWQNQIANLHISSRNEPFSPFDDARDIKLGPCSPEILNGDKICKI